MLTRCQEYTHSLFVGSQSNQVTLSVGVILYMILIAVMIILTFVTMVQKSRRPPYSDEVVSIQQFTSHCSIDSITMCVLDK